MAKNFVQNAAELVQVTIGGARYFRFIPFWGIAVFFRYTRRRVRCPVHKIIAEWLPWADDKSRLTYALKLNLAQWAKYLSRKAVIILVLVTNYLHPVPVFPITVVVLGVLVLLTVTVVVLCVRKVLLAKQLSCSNRMDRLPVYMEVKLPWQLSFPSTTWKRGEIVTSLVENVHLSLFPKLHYTFSSGSQIRHLDSVG